MDNPKIITVEKGTEVSLFGSTDIFKTTHKQHFIVTSETEDHFFYKDDKENRVAVWKDKINKVTFKDRKIKFEDLKKAEILNVMDNYRRLVIRAQKQSKLISSFDIHENDMSIYDPEDIRTGNTRTHFILFNEHMVDGEVLPFSCKVPKKYLWSKEWRTKIPKDYTK